MIGNQRFGRRQRTVIGVEIPVPHGELCEFLQRRSLPFDVFASAVWHGRRFERAGGARSGECRDRGCRQNACRQETTCCCESHYVATSVSVNRTMLPSGRVPPPSHRFAQRRTFPATTDSRLRAPTK